MDIFTSARKPEERRAHQVKTLPSKCKRNICQMMEKCFSGPLRTCLESDPTQCTRCKILRMRVQRRSQQNGKGRKVERFVTAVRTWRNRPFNIPWKSVLLLSKSRGGRFAIDRPVLPWTLAAPPSIYKINTEFLTDVKDFWLLTSKKCIHKSGIHWLMSILGSMRRKENSDIGKEMKVLMEKLLEAWKKNAESARDICFVARPFCRCLNALLFSIFSKVKNKPSNTRFSIPDEN